MVKKYKIRKLSIAWWVTRISTLLITTVGGYVLICAITAIGAVKYE